MSSINTSQLNTFCQMFGMTETQSLVFVKSIEINYDTHEITIRTEILSRQHLNQDNRVAILDHSEKGSQLRASPLLLQEAGDHAENATVNLINETGKSKRSKLKALTKDDISHIQSVVQEILKSLNPTPKTAVTGPTAKAEKTEKTNHGTVASPTLLPRASTGKKDKSDSREKQRLSAQREHNREWHEKQDQLKEQERKKNEKDRILKHEIIQEGIEKERIQEEEINRPKKT